MNWSRELSIVMNRCLPKVNYGTSALLTVWESGCDQRKQGNQLSVDSREPACGQRKQGNQLSVDSREQACGQRKQGNQWFNSSKPEPDKIEPLIHWHWNMIEYAEDHRSVVVERYIHENWWCHAKDHGLSEVNQCNERTQVYFERQQSKVWLPKFSQPKTHVGIIQSIIY